MLRSLGAAGARKACEISGLGLACVFAVLAIAQDSSQFARASAIHELTHDKEAAALVAELLSQKPPKDLALEGVLKTRGTRGKWERVEVQYAVQLTDEGWLGTYEARPGDSGGRERLVVVHQDGKSNVYLYWPKGSSPDLHEEPRRLTGDQAAIPFAATEFWLSDLGLEFLHWPTQRMVKNAWRTMVAGRACKVLESVNPSPAATSYSRVVSWIDSEYGGVIHAEAYDASGKKMKEFSLKGFAKGQVTEMQMVNPKTDTRTRLELEIGEN
ncbi:MAG: outer membrane lipoprotein-sorting protein [Verrucomicrobia bacterium]|nr:outer membrane lipoprotein-sorting protein [Verrucomicrobiota bacterium]